MPFSYIEWVPSCRKLHFFPTHSKNFWQRRSCMCNQDFNFASEFPPQKKNWGFLSSNLAIFDELFPRRFSDNFPRAQNLGWELPSPATTPLITLNIKYGAAPPSPAACSLWSQAPLPITTNTAAAAVAAGQSVAIKTANAKNVPRNARRRKAKVEADYHTLEWDLPDLPYSVGPCRTRPLVSTVQFSYIVLYAPDERSQKFNCC